MQTLSALTRVFAVISMWCLSSAYPRIASLILQTTQLMAPINDLTNHTQLVQLMNSGKTVMDEIRSLVGLEMETEGAEGASL